MAPSNKTILAIAEKFHHTGSVLCQQKGTAGRPRTVTTNENHERLLQQVLQSPKRSLRRTSLKLGVCDRSVRRMYRATWNRIPYSSFSGSKSAFTHVSGFNVIKWSLSHIVRSGRNAGAGSDRQPEVISTCRRSERPPACRLQCFLMSPFTRM